MTFIPLLSFCEKSFSVFINLTFFLYSKKNYEFRKLIAIFIEFGLMKMILSKMDFSSAAWNPTDWIVYYTGFGVEQWIHIRIVWSIFNRINVVIINVDIIAPLYRWSNWEAIPLMVEQDKLLDKNSTESDSKQKCRYFKGIIKKVLNLPTKCLLDWKLIHLIDISSLSSVCLTFERIFLSKGK